MAHFGARIFFFNILNNVKFLDLFQANFTQKNQKRLMTGTMRTFVTDRQQTDRTELITKDPPAGIAGPIRQNDLTSGI